MPDRMRLNLFCLLVFSGQDAGDSRQHQHAPVRSWFRRPRRSFDPAHPDRSSRLPDPGERLKARTFPTAVGVRRARPLKFDACRCACSLLAHVTLLCLQMPKGAKNELFCEMQLDYPLICSTFEFPLETASCVCLSAHVHAASTQSSRAVQQDCPRLDSLLSVRMNARGR